VGIWFFVTDDHGKMLPYNPQPRPSAAAGNLNAARQRRPHIFEHGEPGAAVQRASPAERQTSRPARKREVFDKLKSQEVHAAAADPNSMFDMSTP